MVKGDKLRGNMKNLMVGDWVLISLSYGRFKFILTDIEKDIYGIVDIQFRRSYSPDKTLWTTYAGVEFMQIEKYKPSKFEIRVAQLIFKVSGYRYPKNYLGKFVYRLKTNFSFSLLLSFVYKIDFKLTKLLYSFL